MFFKFVSRLREREPVNPETLQLGSRTVPLLVVRNPRARRYLLRLRADGTARVTIPRGGSRSEAQSFIERNREWLHQQVEKLLANPRLPAAWHVGTEIYFRGELVRIEAPNSNDQAPENIQASNTIQMGTATLVVRDLGANLRPAIERHLRGMASRELPIRVMELAAVHQLKVQRVTVRNQRSRWGSCSRRATISLNWRLVQTPDFVRDYIILHELAHLREMNHSHRFWREVERLCPDFREAEKWLKVNRQLLR